MFNINALLQKVDLAIADYKARTTATPGWDSINGIYNANEEDWHLLRPDVAALDLHNIYRIVNCLSDADFSHENANIFINWEDRWTIDITGINLKVIFQAIMNDDFLWPNVGRLDMFNNTIKIDLFCDSVQICAKYPDV